MILTQPIEVVLDQGSVVVMSAAEDNESGRRWEFAADHRMAQQIIDAEPEYIELESWQLLGPGPK